MLPFGSGRWAVSPQPHPPLVKSMGERIRIKGKKQQKKIVLIQRGQNKFP